MKTISNKKGYYFFTILTVVFITILLSSCEQFKTSIKDTFKSEKEVESSKNELSSAKEAGSSKQDEKVGKSDTQSSAQIPSVVQEELAPFNDRSYYEKAQRELLSLPQLKDKELFCYSSIHFYDDGRINLTLQDPNNATYLDAYSYRKGAWEDPKPMQSLSESQMVRGRYPLSKINFSTVVDLCEKINLKIAETPGAEEMSHIYITYSSYKKKIDWRGSFRGDRESYSIWADADGSNLRFDRN